MKPCSDCGRDKGDDEDCPACSPGGPDDIIECWCGAKGTYEELFSDHSYEDSCGGTHEIHCECSGDGLCVCHHHGSYECPGCEDCEGDEDGDYDDYDEDF
jgi:hypothetical protein